MCIAYCVYCDSIYLRHAGEFRKCKNCIEEYKSNPMELIELWQRLPHKKAKLIIETQFIPELAHIIFNYYYARRYLLGEY